MARTVGSGWGNGMIRLYQVCPFCGKKKALWVNYKTFIGQKDFKCTNCQESFNSDTLLKVAYAGEQNCNRRK